jgi:dephospho-CoA kinase
MRVWGLTGGIGAGKSEAARVLRTLGVPVLDADQVARAQMAPGSPVHDAVIDAFGTGILGPDGRVDRGRLAAIVFADPALRTRLDALTHGPVMATLQQRLDRLAEGGHPLAVIEAALVFETGLDRTLDGTIAVVAPIDVRVARVRARDGVDEAAVRARIAAQVDDDARRARATRVIENAGDLDALRAAISDVLVRILSGA